MICILCIIYCQWYIVSMSMYHVYLHLELAKFRDSPSWWSIIAIQNCDFLQWVSMLSLSRWSVIVVRDIASLPCILFVYNTSNQKVEVHRAIDFWDFCWRLFWGQERPYIQHCARVCCAFLWRRGQWAWQSLSGILLWCIRFLHPYSRARSSKHVLGLISIHTLHIAVLLVSHCTRILQARPRYCARMGTFHSISNARLEGFSAEAFMKGLPCRWSPGCSSPSCQHLKLQGESPPRAGHVHPLHPRHGLGKNIWTEGSTDMVCLSFWFCFWFALFSEWRMKPCTML